MISGEESRCKWQIYANEKLFLSQKRSLIKEFRMSDGVWKNNYFYMIISIKN